MDRKKKDRERNREEKVKERWGKKVRRKKGRHSWEGGGKKKGAGDKRKKTGKEADGFCELKAIS